MKECAKIILSSQGRPVFLVNLDFWLNFAHIYLYIYIFFFEIYRQLNDMEIVWLCMILCTQMSCNQACFEKWLDSDYRQISHWCNLAKIDLRRSVCFQRCFWQYLSPPLSQAKSPRGVMANQGVAIRRFCFKKKGRACCGKTSCNLMGIFLDLTLPQPQQQWKVKVSKDLLNVYYLMPSMDGIFTYI